MGGVIGRVVDSYADSDDDQLPIGFELQDRHDHPGRHEEVEIPLGELPPAAAASPLLFGGNAFANGDPQNPVNEVMLPLLQRLASSTPQLSHTRTVTCPFNVNKGSIKLVPRTTTANAAPSSTLYDLQFTIDATEACIVKVFYCVDEKSSHHSYARFPFHFPVLALFSPSFGTHSNFCFPINIDLPTATLSRAQKLEKLLPRPILHPFPSLPALHPLLKTPTT